jgi:hypothetical protein
MAAGGVAQAMARLPALERRGCWITPMDNACMKRGTRGCNRPCTSQVVSLSIGDYTGKLSKKVVTTNRPLLRLVLIHTKVKSAIYR